MWVNEKVTDNLRDGKKHSPSEIIDILYNVHGVRVGAVVMSHSLTDIKNVMWQEGTSFGHVRSYLDALRTNNDGTDTSLVVEEGVFKRAFVALGMCVRAFAVSTRVVGLDACHVKAKHGGVMLVMTCWTVTAVCSRLLWPSPKARIPHLDLVPHASPKGVLHSQRRRSRCSQRP